MAPKIASLDDCQPLHHVPEIGLLSEASSSMPTATASSVIRMCSSIGRQFTAGDGWVALNTQSKSHSRIGAERASWSGASSGLQACKVRGVGCLGL